MKSVAAILALLMIGTAVHAGPKNYGKTLTIKETTRISDIYSQPQKYADKRVLVEGAVVNVCKKRGCWIEIGSDKEFQSIRFKVEDGVIIFPMEARGQTVRAEGIVSVRTTSVEEQVAQGKKHAEESGEEFDPASVKGPKTTVMLKGEGAEVR